MPISRYGDNQKKEEELFGNRSDVSNGQHLGVARLFLKLGALFTRTLVYTKGKLNKNPPDVMWVSPTVLVEMTWHQNIIETTAAARPRSMKEK